MAPRVVVLGLASDYGCQVQMTNQEDRLLDVLGAIDLTYWQLATSGHMPEDYDVAVIEGAVTTEEHVELLTRVRETAAVVIVIGACAMTGGIPGMAAVGDLEERVGCVYGEDGSIVACGRIAPAPINSVIDVDYYVPGCPIDPDEFVAVLQRALLGLKDDTPKDVMCGLCKIEENICFWDQGVVCLGLVTRAGCGARCISLGRPCTGCRGIAESANLPAAEKVAADRGLSVSELLDREGVYNTAKEALK